MLLLLTIALSACFSSEKAVEVRARRDEREREREQALRDHARVCDPRFV